MNAFKSLSDEDLTVALESAMMDASKTQTALANNSVYARRINELEEELTFLRGEHSMLLKEHDDLKKEYAKELKYIGRIESQLEQQISDVVEDWRA